MSRFELKRVPFLAALRNKETEIGANSRNSWVGGPVSLMPFLALSRKGNQKFDGVHNPLKVSGRIFKPTTTS